MLPVFGLYTHIRANRIRSVALMASLFALVYVAIFAGVLLADGMIYDDGSATIIMRAWRQFLVALPWATALLAAWALFAFRFNQAIVDVTTGARDPTPTERRRIEPLLEDLCISRGLKTPRLEILETTALNAFATGATVDQYAITLTTGLLDHLGDSEIRAVLGHEITHIRNEDVRLMTIAVVIAGVISFFAEFVFRMLSNGFSWGGSSKSSSSDSKDSGAGFAILLALALLALAWTLSLSIRLALSRSREYLADAGSVELTKDPDSMISALRKIDTRGEIEGVPSGVMEMCLDNPRSGFADLFSTHPSIESRIKALEDFAGGRATPAATPREPYPRGATS